jgi:hypothetical protein
MVDNVIDRGLEEKKNSQQVYEANWATDRLKRFSSRTDFVISELSYTSSPPISLVDNQINI